MVQCSRRSLPVAAALIGRFRFQCQQRWCSGPAKVRGKYARVTDADVHHFKSLLGESNVLTGRQNVGPYNVDYLKHVSGKPTNPRVHRSSITR
jgi:hypothetical protein